MLTTGMSRQTSFNIIQHRMHAWSVVPCFPSQQDEYHINAYRKPFSSQPIDSGVLLWLWVMDPSDTGIDSRDWTVSYWVFGTRGICKYLLPKATSRSMCKKTIFFICFLPWTKTIFYKKSSCFLPFQGNKPAHFFQMLWGTQVSSGLHVIPL